MTSSAYPLMDMDGVRVSRKLSRQNSAVLFDISGPTSPRQPKPARLASAQSLAPATASEEKSPAPVTSSSRILLPAPPPSEQRAREWTQDPDSPSELLHRENYIESSDVTTEQDKTG